MTRNTLITATLSAALLIAAAPGPAEAGSSFGIHISNHGVGFGFGGANWGIWGSSWNSGHLSAGFSATLDGYGEWVSVDGLGRVWRPWVATGWQPYSHGRWVWTSLGWTWVAYEPWGWVPHHYGNWAFTTIGWVWAPGYSYHPGNVVWVSSGDYIGWIPCAPRGWSHAQREYRHGWTDGYHSGRYDGYNQGYEDGWRDARYATWVPSNYMTSDNVSHHAVRLEVVTHSVAHSRIVPMAAAPSRTSVERMVGRAVPEVRIANRTATIDGRTVRVVRPEGQAETVRRQGAETVKDALSHSARERAAGAPASRPQPIALSTTNTATAARSTEIRSERTVRTATTTSRRYDSAPITAKRSTDISSAPRDRGVEVSRSRSGGNRIGPLRTTSATASKRTTQPAPPTTANRPSSRTTSPYEPATRTAGARSQRSTRAPTVESGVGARARSKSTNSVPEREETGKRRQRQRG